MNWLRTIQQNGEAALGVGAFLFLTLLVALGFTNEIVKAQHPVPACSCGARP